MKKEKKIIFGGLGFIGYKITKKLCDRGFNFDVIDLKSSRKL